MEVKDPLRKAGLGVLVFKGLGRSPPAAMPHLHSAAGTPRCSPAGPAHIGAPASSLSETWVPGLRTPGGWVCWAGLPPSGCLKTGGPVSLYRGPWAGGLVLFPDLPQLLSMLSTGQVEQRYSHPGLIPPATPYPGHLAPPTHPQRGCGPCLYQKGEHHESASPLLVLSWPGPSPAPAQHPLKVRGCVRHQH